MKKLLVIACLYCTIKNCFAQNKSFNINAYGAVGDGKTVNTKALQTAVDDCNKNGGGMVVVPTGVYIIGTVHLKSNVQLFLEKGSILRGSSNLQDYDVFVPEKPYVTIHKGMLFTENAENISINGEGQIDGNGDQFFDLQNAKKLDAQTTRYTRQKDNYRHVESGIGDGPVVPKDRPHQMFVFSNCKRVSVKDIFVTNAPFWCMHFADCDAVNVTGISISSNLLIPNADGIDITSCTNVIVSNCDIRTGDDALAIVGFNHHFEIPGFKYLRHLSENIVVSNCNLQSASSGIRIGFLDQNTVRNVLVNNCNITNSTRGIGLFLRDEGSLENIIFSNINIETKMRTGDWWGNGEPIHISAIRGKGNVVLGKIKNVQFNNINCKGENGMLIYGTPESVIEDVAFDNIRFELLNSNLNNIAGGNIDLRGCMGDSNQLFKHDIPGLFAQYVNGLSINNFKLTWDNQKEAYFTNGIEIDHFKDLKIDNFKGHAAPASKSGVDVLLTNGVNVELELKTKSIKQINVL